MIHYKLGSTHPNSHFAEIEMHIDNIVTDELTIELPSWRPGRYELGNFAKNIRRWSAYNNKNEMLAFRKTSKDTWQVSTEGASEIIIRYEYFCEQPDAGGCWIDENQIYINPVHCFLFIHERMHEEHKVELVIPFGYKSFSVVNWSALTANAWLALIFIVALATFLAYFLNTYVMKLVNPSLAGSYIYLQPVFASIIAVYLGKDVITWEKSSISMLIFIGIYLVSKKSISGNS